jgi:hypothetical protein
MQDHLYVRPMNNVQQAIRDAAENGGYRYRWWKVNDLEQSEGRVASDRGRH